MPYKILQNISFFRETLDSWKTHCTLVEDIEMNIEKMVRRWEQFETDLASHKRWMGEVTQKTWNKKEGLESMDQLVELRNGCKRTFNDIISYEKHISDFLTTSNNLEEISGSKNVAISINQTQNEFANIKESNAKDLEEIEAILIVTENYERSLQEAKEWLDTFEAGLEACEDTNQYLQKELGSGFQLGDETFPPVLEKSMFEGKKALALLSNNYKAVHDPDTLYEQWNNILVKVQRCQDLEKAANNLQRYQIKLKHFTECLDEMLDEKYEDRHINWTYPPSIASAIEDIKGSLSKFSKEYTELKNMKLSFLESNVMIADGASELQSNLTSIVARYESYENSLSTKIVDLEETLAGVTEYEKKKEGVNSGFKIFQETLNKIKFPNDAHEWNLTNLNHRMKLAEKLIEQLSSWELLQDLENYSRNILSIPLEEKACLEDAVSKFKDTFCSLSQDAEENRRTLQNAISYLNNYTSQNEEIADWLQTQEDILSNFHYQATLLKKQEQKEAFTTVLQTSENWKQTSLNRYVDFLREMEGYFKRQKQAVDSAEADEAEDYFSAEDESVSVYTEKGKQTASRFEMIEQKLRYTLEQCTESINVHMEFNEIMKRCEGGLENLSITKDSNSNVSSDEISSMKTDIEFMFRELIIQGKELANTTSPAGFAEIQQRMADLQQRKNMILHNADDQVGDLSLSEKTDEVGEDFDFSSWLEEKENLLMFKEVQPQTSLDEKSRLLKALKHEVIELANSTDALRALEGHPDNQEVLRYKNLIQESKLIIKKHEEGISNQRKITTTLVDLNKRLDEIETFLSVVSDSENSKERLLQNNETLKRFDFSKIYSELGTLKGLANTIIPVAAESEQDVMTADLSSTEERIITLHSTFDNQQGEIADKMEKLNLYETKIDVFMKWMDEVNEQLDKYKLRCNIQKKLEHVKNLKSLQSEVAMKELELSDIEHAREELENEADDKLSKVVDIYHESQQNIGVLISKLQNELDSNDVIITKIKDMQSFITEQKEQLESTLQTSASNHSEMTTKREAIDTLIKSKEQGNAMVIEIVKMQENVLPMIPQEDQTDMKNKVKRLHNEWHQFISLLTEKRLVFDNQINDWKEITEHCLKIGTKLDEIENMLKEVNASNTSLSKLREQVDTLRHIKEKLRCTKLDIDTIQRNVVDGCTTGSNHPDWPFIVFRFESLMTKLQEELSIREDTLHNYREYKNHLSDLEQFLQRCKDKVQTVEQRSPNDKNYANAIIQALSNLLNKEAQGQIMIEHVEQASAVLISKTPNYETEIRKRTNDLKSEFNRLFEEVSKQNKRLNIIMKYFGEFKDETERLTDWIKQININIKAIKTSLPSILSDKKKSLDDMRELCVRLDKGKEQIQKYVELADKMNDSPLESNVATQKKEIVSKFQSTNNSAIEVLERVQTMHDYHHEFQTQVETARKWMERAWEKIRQNSNSVGKSKDDLHRQLGAIQQEIDNQNQGLGYVQAAMDNAEKAMKNTRSDGKDAIQQSVKELNADWEKLTRKMATAKVGVETDLLQWSDEQQSASRLEEWIKDRENRLHAAVKQKNVMITRRSTLGITTLSVSERSKSLGQTNMILQDIQAFEPLVQKFTAGTSSGNTAGDSPLLDIAKKYRDLSKHAQEVFDHEKDMIQKHESFMTAGNDFMQWLKTAKEKLDKCSEPVDEKDFLSEKLTHLKILEADIGEGKAKLDFALQMAVDACSLALDDDR